MSVNGGWGEFGAWDACPVSCGGAEHSRYRTCDNPAPAHGGEDCSGSNTETERCNENPCPVNGGWGEFGAWDECPVSCGGAEHSRVRTCDSPAPAHGGNDCTVDGSSNTEVERCNENPCPVNGGWGEWSTWSQCPVTCGGGEIERTRACDSPAPQHGGEECTTDGSSGSEKQTCNETPCPIHRLNSQDVLQSGQQMISENGEYVLKASGTYGDGNAPYYVKMQKDNHLVLYDSSSK